MDRSAVTVGPGMDLPIMHDSDRYELVRDIGSGNFGVARLMRDKQTEELVAVKYIERGDKVSVLIISSFSICGYLKWISNISLCGNRKSSKSPMTNLINESYLEQGLF